MRAARKTRSWTRGSRTTSPRSRIVRSRSTSEYPAHLFVSLCSPLSPLSVCGLSRSGAGSGARGRGGKPLSSDGTDALFASAGKYVEAIDALQKLSEEIAPDRDLKVQHNLVLAAFVSGKYSSIEFEQNLRNLLSLVADDMGKQRKNGNGDDGSGSLERESSFVRYNLAVSLFQQKQYAAASAVLEVLMRNIEPIDEKVAMHVCFLYLDIILHSSRGCVVTEQERLSTVKKAQSIVAYLEKPHGYNGQVVTPHAEDTSSSNAANNDAVATDADKQPRKDSIDTIEFRFRLHLYKAKLNLLQVNLKTAKKEVKSALEIFQKEIKSRDRSTEENSARTTTGTNAATEKTSTAIGHPSLAVQNSTALFLKANLEYLRKNYKKCVKLLASCTKEAVDEVRRLGCLVDLAV